MFKITQGKGFNITFENGWAVSVQWGPGNYCDQKEKMLGIDYSVPDAFEKRQTECGAEGSNTAEIAVFNPQGDMVMLDGDTVEGWLSPDAVLAYFVRAASSDPGWNPPED